MHGATVQAPTLLPAAHRSATQTYRSTLEMIHPCLGCLPCGRVRRGKEARRVVCEPAHQVHDRCFVQQRVRTGPPPEPTSNSPHPSTWPCPWSCLNFGAIPPPAPSAGTLMTQILLMNGSLLGETRECCLLRPGNLPPPLFFAKRTLFVGREHWRHMCATPPPPYGPWPSPSRPDYEQVALHIS